MNKKHQFEQQFEDSQANFSEAAPQRTDERMSGTPMQLLKVQRNGKIEINEEALNLIASCDAQVGFVSLVGKMRTGKSCLLNRLLGLPGRGFRVDASVSSCTQGIWIWSQPVFNETLNCFIFFMDTEGADSLEKDADNDAKIFTLSLLISSYLVYNSVGCIDERSISQLEMVTALSQHLRADENLNERENQESLYRYMPKFMWLLRDVTLKIEDERGRKITPTQYLENCLSDQPSSNSLQANKKIKKSLLTYFKDRQCMTMVRPVGDQADLQRLDTIPDHALRRQFVESVNSLKEKLIRGCGPKDFGGEPIVGPIMAELIQSFVQGFNNGKVPSIKSAWEQISEDEGAAAFNAAVVKYEEVFREEFPDDSPKSDDQIRKILTKLREGSMKEFQANCFNKKHEDMHVKLKNLIDEKETNIIEINKNVCEAKNHQILKNLSQKMKTKLASNAYDGRKKDMQQDFDDVLEQYNRQAKGPNKAEILSEFVRTINPLFFSMDSNADALKKKEEQNRDRLRIQELERLAKLKQKENQSLKQQLKAKQNQPAKMPNRADKHRQERETQGCCSGDKCLVM